MPDAQGNLRVDALIHGQERWQGRAVLASEAIERITGFDRDGGRRSEGEGSEQRQKKGAAHRRAEYKGSVKGL